MQHVQFCLTQGERRGRALSHTPVEGFHELRSGHIIDLPQADDHSRRSRVEKRSRQSDHSFPANQFPESSLARLQKDCVGRPNSKDELLQRVERQATSLLRNETKPVHGCLLFEGRQCVARARIAHLQFYFGLSKSRFKVLAHEALRL